MTDMRHMNYISNVALEDVKELERKEATYRGSWKKRGGVGTAMMLLRKIDRLEVMLEQRGYDIFKDMGDGSDGTMLAEIRDLRRYLLLTDAENKSRASGPVMLSDATGVCYKPEVQGEVAQSRAEIHVHTQNQQFMDDLNRPGTPEDGGHHAKWPVERLQDGLKADDIEPADLGFYIIGDMGHNTRIVDREHVSSDLWDHLPRLDMELNEGEYQQLPREYMRLYQWNNDKWLMRPQYKRDWGKQ